MRQGKLALAGGKRMLQGTIFLRRAVGITGSTVEEAAMVW